MFQGACAQQDAKQAKKEARKEARKEAEPKKAEDVGIDLLDIRWVSGLHAQFSQSSGCSPVSKSFFKS